jgi:Putative zinc-finger
MTTRPLQTPIADLDWCDRFRAGLVTHYLEGALPADQLDQVEFHLLICPGCAELLHTHRHLITMFRVLGGAIG